MTALAFIVIGLLVGALAYQVTESPFGVWGHLAVGVLGALCGGFLFDAVGLDVYGVTGPLVVSIIGAAFTSALLLAFSPSEEERRRMLP